jgi:hypothetical protein
MDEFAVWLLVIAVGCTVLWLVSVYRSRKRASLSGCVFCGKDLGHKAHGGTVNDVLAANHYWIFSTRYTALHISVIKRSLCLSCSRVAIRRLYMHYVACIVFSALVILGLLVHEVYEAAAGHLDPAMLCGLVPAMAVSACFIYLFNRRAQYTKRALKKISKAIHQESKA